MPGRLEFFYDYGSPYSYLADTRLEALQQRTSCELVYRPMLLGGVFKATQELTERFGPERCFNTPIAESSIVGVAIGLFLLEARR